MKFCTLILTLILKRNQCFHSQVSPVSCCDTDSRLWVPASRSVEINRYTALHVLVSSRSSSENLYILQLTMTVTHVTTAGIVNSELLSPNEVSISSSTRRHCDVCMIMSLPSVYWYCSLRQRGRLQRHCVTSLRMTVHLVIMDSMERHASFNVLYIIITPRNNLLVIYRREMCNEVRPE